MLSRTTILRIALYLAVALIVPVFVSVVGEFFIELAKEHGLYSEPTKRLGAAMSALSGFFTQTWFLVLSAFVCGTAIGLWTDTVLRRRDFGGGVAADLADTHSPLGAPGALDYVVEGVQALNDISTTFNGATKDAAKMTRILTYYRLRLSLAQNINRKRKLASSVARRLNHFSDTMRRMAARVTDAGNRTHDNSINLIEVTPIDSPQELAALLSFGKTVDSMITSVGGNVEALEGTRMAVNTMSGQSRELNGAIEAYSTATDQAIVAFRDLEAKCINVRAKIAIKAAEATGATG